MTKVTSSTDALTQAHQGVNKPAGKQSAAGRPDEAAGPAGAGRDFASVFENVSRSRDAERRDNDAEGERREQTGAAARAEREREAERREDGQGASSGGGAFHLGRGVQQAGAGPEFANARAILHVVDLERIVAAIRTQVNALGRREVLLDMHRSVLEGLRVRLSADAAGRVTAEFIAASEKVKAQLDARAGELAGLLRARGVNLAALRTVVRDEGGEHGGRGRDDEGSAEAEFSA